MNSRFLARLGAQSIMLRSHWRDAAVVQATSYHMPNFRIVFDFVLIVNNLVAIAINGIKCNTTTAAAATTSMKLYSSLFDL